jgi:hypothetical protein
MRKHSKEQLFLLRTLFIQARHWDKEAPNCDSVGLGLIIGADQTVAVLERASKSGNAKRVVPKGKSHNQNPLPVIKAPMTTPTQFREFHG